MEDNWTASTTKDHVYFNGQLIATRDQAAYVRVLFKDHLGSIRSVVKVDPPGDGQLWGLDWTTVEVHDYRPYGVAWSSYWDDSEQTSQRFTGQKRDSESGLDYFGARYYDFGSVGGQPRGNPRWISPDPIMGRADDPSSLNKYGYVRNDPINYVDHDGADPGFVHTCAFVFGTMVCSITIFDTLPGPAWKTNTYSFTLPTFQRGGGGGSPALRVGRQLLQDRIDRKNLNQALRAVISSTRLSGVSGPSCPQASQLTSLSKIL